MLGVKENKRTAGQTLGPVSPNGKVDAELNALYLDTANAILWIKEFEGKKSGWKCLGHVVPDGIEGSSGRV